MSVLVDSATRLCVQGITGRIGRAQTEYMRRAGTRIVTGVTPGRRGEEVHGVPVFDCVSEAQAQGFADVSILFVPPGAAEEAGIDAISSGVKLVVLVTEGVPVHAAMRLRARAAKVGARLLGPTTPGVITPGEAKVGIMPERFFTPGRVGIISRSGTLSYEIAGGLSAAGIGQSTVVGLGADPVVGTDVTELLGLFEADPETEAVVLIGEVGGTQEERAAHFAAAQMSKPVVAYITGREAVPGVRMGHAGALIREGTGSAADKVEALTQAGVSVADEPAQVVELVQRALGLG